MAQAQPVLGYFKGGRPALSLMQRKGADNRGGVFGVINLLVRLTRPMVVTMKLGWKWLNVAQLPFKLIVCA
ncbi:MAG: hypothetical protein AAGD96_14995 [Chloroflexota bacterium]